MGIFSNIFRKNKKSDCPELGLIDNSSPFALRQAYKALYTNILYLNIDAKCKKIVVSSALPGECKSTVSSNLSFALSENHDDKKILLIDGDIRSPKIWKNFGLKRNAKGLSEYLAGIDEVPNFQRYNDSNLYILTSGSQSVNPTKLIGSPRMKMLLELCEGEFDYVIIDTPPINIVSDALLLSSVAHGYVLSMRSDVSDINSYSQCVEYINNTGADIFGVVLSGVKLKGGSSKYSRYNKYEFYDSKEINYN